MSDRLHLIFFTPAAASLGAVAMSDAREVMIAGARL